MPFLLVVAAIPTSNAQVSVQFELVAKSGQTPIPGGSGTFSDFKDKPAIDDQGNIVFYGIGSDQRGIYTAVGSCCQKVADFNTLVPSGGGETFNNFSGGVSNDIDNGRVAFIAQFGGYAGAPDFLGVYSNAGQANAQTLAEVAVVDGLEWSDLGDPWIDNGVVALRGTRLIPSSHNTILLWDSWDGSQGFVDADSGYSITSSGDAGLSGDAVIFPQLGSGRLELAISTLSGMETLAATGVTLVPGGGGATFKNFRPAPVVDRNGQDAAFVGYYSSSPTLAGVYKRTGYGALQKVTDSTSGVPGAEPMWDGSDNTFKEFDAAGLSLSNRQVAFLGFGQNALKGLYTDVGGSLEVLVDTGSNNLINLGGTVASVMALGMGPKSFAYTPQGFQLVFQATFESGEKALIRATVSTGASTTNAFTVYKDFSDNNTAYVSISLSCTSGTVTNSPQWAREGVPAVFSISGATSGATCTATESVPSGYTKNESGCQNRPLNGSCTIVNTAITQEPAEDVFWVWKDFSDGNSGSVSISLSCTSGTVTNNPQWASESAPAKFYISGAASNATCAATENSVPSGYTKDESDCQDGDRLNSACVIVNTKQTTSSASFTVYKDYSDNNTDYVSVALSCSSGTVTNTPQWAREGAPAVFTISGAASGATCTATETSVASGYTKDESNCQNRPINGSCTLLNTLNQQGNQPPNAYFTYSCTGLTCSFNGSGSSDSDGSITNYYWNFGDGTTGSGVTTSRTYGAGGTYTATLTVVDNQGATDSYARSVSVSGSSAITLSVTGYKDKGQHKANLSWSGAGGSNVDVYRNDVFITRTANDGFHTDNINQRGSGTYTYKVCNAGTSTCSSGRTISI